MSIRLFPRPLFVKALLSCLFLLVTISCLSIYADRASAHGYVEGPASRAILCKQGANTDCGAIIYEPQSLEAPKGFPAAGPADGKIASAGGAFPKLDEQSATRWAKVPMTGGTTTFNWKFTAPHATSSFRYFITKPNWNPNAPLTRDQFDLTPFCTVNYGGAQPPFTYSHSCEVPSGRTGYHVILAVWDVHDTANAFYNVIDVQFPSGPADNVPPTAPSNLSVSNIGTTSAVLSWTGSTDNVQVASYRIYAGSSLLATVPAASAGYTLTGLASGTSYTVHVKAVDSSGNESAASNTVTFTTVSVPVDHEAPSAPPGLHVMGAPSSTSVHLMWSASTDNTGVQGYRIYNGSSLIATVPASSLSYVVTGLTPSTAYTFTVKAYDAAGNESSGSSVSATTAAPPAAAPWAAGVAYTAGTKVTYNGILYECRQSHTSLTGWEPPNVLALWLPL